MTSGKWMVLDSNTREIYGLFQDGAEAIHTVRYSPDGKFLALGSRDGILYIYQVSDDSKKYHRMGRCLVSSPFHIPLWNIFNLKVAKFLAILAGFNMRNPQYSIKNFSKKSLKLPIFSPSF